MEERKEIREPDFRKLASSKKTSKGGKAVTVILLLLCIVLTAAIIYKLYSTHEAAPSAINNSSTLSAINVAAEPAYRGTFSKISRMNGEIARAGNDITIYPDITSSGTVTDVLIDEGNTVKAGDTVAYIDASRPGYSYRVSPVIAKTDGIVKSVNVSAGERISSSTAIAAVTSTDDLVIKAAVPEKFLGTLRTGMTAQFETVAFPGRMYTATLTYIAPSVDRTTRASDIELMITGDADGLKDGMYIKLNLETEHQENVLMVPSSALGTYLGDDTVFIADNGEARRQIVTIGSSNGSETIILSGLEEGALVITAGNVTDGTAISVV